MAKKCYRKKEWKVKMAVELLCCFLRHPEHEKEIRAFTEYLLSLPLPNLNE